MSSIKVLTVEDDTDLREAITMALENAGFEVFSAKNGAEGVQQALTHHPDVILMDVMMPIMNGHEAVDKIRNDAWGKNAKVIFLTSLSDAENVVHAVSQGSGDYLVKPHTSLEDIVNKVKLVRHTD